MSSRKLLIGFVINGVALATVLLALGLANVAIDPFRANRLVELGIDKKPITSKLSYYDWQLPRATQEWAPIVVVGDSRMAALDEDDLTTAAGEPVLNLSAGGARWAEVLAVADYVLDDSPPQELVVQLNVDMLNGSSRMNRVKPVQERLDNPLQYYLHPTITQASFRVLVALVRGGGEVSEAPPMDEEAFWTFQLEQVGKIAYANWSWPDQALRQLDMLIERADKRGVELTVVMLPVHQELRSRLAELGYDDENARLRQALRERVPLVDFDRDSSLTLDKSRFRDPFHLRDEAEPGLAEALFAQGGELAERTRP